MSTATGRKAAPAAAEKEQQATPTPEVNAEAPAPPAGQVPHIYTAIREINKELEVIKKDQDSRQGYKFRGIDDVINHLGPLMKAHDVITTRSEPVYEVGSGEITRNKTQVVNEDGKNKTVVVPDTKPVTWAKCSFELSFVSLIDGSKITTAAFGQGQDSTASDKPLGMAQSNAYKYAVLQMFTILTKDVVDSDMAERKKDKPNTPAPLTAQPVAEQRKVHKVTDEEAQKLCVSVRKVGATAVHEQLKAKAEKTGVVYEFTDAQKAVLGEANAEWLAAQAPAADDNGVY